MRLIPTFPHTQVNPTREVLERYSLSWGVEPCVGVLCGVVGDGEWQPVPPFFAGKSRPQNVGIANGRDQMVAVVGSR